MGLFSRVAKNLQRVFADAAPIVSAVAPFVAPGIGGLVISNIAARFAQAQPTRSSAAVINAGGSLIPPTCRPMGVVGGGFSGPYQARNFTSGGSFSGRPVATFGGRVPVGRDIRAQFCPTPPAQLPIVTAAPALTVQVPTAITPVKEAVTAPATITIPSAVRRGIFSGFRSSDVGFNEGFRAGFA